MHVFFLPQVEVEYVQDSVDLDPTDPMSRHFAKVMEAFKITDEDKEEEKRAEGAAAKKDARAAEETKVRKGK